MSGRFTIAPISVRSVCNTHVRPLEVVTREPKLNEEGWVVYHGVEDDKGASRAGGRQRNKH